MLLLSSVERLIRFLCVEDNATNRRVLNQYLYAVSNNIQAYLSAKFELKARTEYFDIRRNEQEFWIEGVPIVSITSVIHDIDGKFDGSGTAIDSDNYITGIHDKSVVISFPQYPGRKVLQIIYTGGVSNTSTKSTFAITPVSGTFLVNKFATGSTSGASGIITAYSSSSITIDTLYGTFVAGETLTMQTTEGGADVSNVSATLDSITVQSFAELLPEVTLACDLQIRYNVKTMDDFELKSIDKDKSARRDSQKELTFRGAYQDLQPEVRSLINKHRRIFV